MSVTAPDSPKKYHAGVAHFTGDVRSIVGEVKGPTTYGSMVCADSADYDADADRTTVQFVHVRPAEVSA